LFLVDETRQEPTLWTYSKLLGYFDIFFAGKVPGVIHGSEESYDIIVSFSQKGMEYVEYSSIVEEHEDTKEENAENIAINDDE
jgi:hypothetical protein